MTSHDVLDSLILSGVTGQTTFWSQVTQVSAPSPTTVHFTLRPGVPLTLFETNLLGLVITPASVYGRFVPVGLERDLITSSIGSAAAPGPTSRSTTRARRAIGSALKNVDNFRPKSLLGDGPFYLVRMNSSEAYLSKSPTFYRAKYVRATSLEDLNSPSNEVVISELLGGKITFETVGTPRNLVSEYRKKSFLRYLTPAGLAFREILFNCSRYPFNLSGVRQALAYIINRKRVVALAEAGQDRVPEHPTGIVSQILDAWTTKAQRSSLNSYGYDPSRATSILRVLHFSKESGKWVMPDGKPFTVSILTYSGYTGPEESAVVIAKELSNFGIPSSADAVTPDSVHTAIDAGHFQMAIDFGGSGPDPLTELSDVLGPNLNFISTGAESGEKGLGFGPTMEVPGLGKVDVPTTIAHQADTIGGGKQMAEDTWDWIRLVNSQLPFIQYIDTGAQLEYSTLNFTHWPKSNNHLWSVTANDTFGGVLLMFQDGYMAPRP